MIQRLPSLLNLGDGCRSRRIDGNASARPQPSEPTPCAGGPRLARTRRYAPSRLNHSSVHALLSNPFHIGRFVHNGRHEAIISEELFDQVQAVLEAHSKSGERDRKHPTTSRARSSASGAASPRLLTQLASPFKEIVKLDAGAIGTIERIKAKRRLIPDERIPVAAGAVEDDEAPDTRQESEDFALGSISASMVDPSRLRRNRRARVEALRQALVASR
jgi:hypothetical protein